MKVLCVSTHINTFAHTRKVRVEGNLRWGFSSPTHMLLLLQQHQHVLDWKTLNIITVVLHPLSTQTHKHS